jgi:glycosyltransferase involved in cell wall biosynthesis
MPSPYWNFAATVSTLHAPYENYKGEYFLSPIMKAYWRLYGRPQMKMNTAVVAVSEFMRDYGVERVGLRPEAIHVIRNGSSEAFRPMAPVEYMPVLQKFGLAPGYVLCVGNVTVVKNHITAIRALADLVGRVDAKLVIAGATVHRHSCYQELLAEIQRLRLGDRVRFLGLVDREHLPALLNGGRVMALPSLQEGCPVAMIECFKCGTPVIGSVVPPVAELGRGVAPLLDDPRDHRQLAAYLLEVLTSDQRHAELRRLALEAGSRYSWRKSALAHLKVYETCFNIRQETRRRLVSAEPYSKPEIEAIRSARVSIASRRSNAAPLPLRRHRL